MFVVTTAQSAPDDWLSAIVGTSRLIINTKICVFAVLCRGNALSAESGGDRHHESAVAEGDLVARPHSRGPDQSPAVEPGPVHRAEVDQQPVVLLAEQLGVDPGD